MANRKGYSIKQEFITNGLLVTLNGKDRVYFKQIEHFQAFYKFWTEDDSRSIKDCLDLMKKELDVSLQE